jgi:hypothetical protein
MFEDYSSSWEWTRERSQYHFDWTKRDQTGEWWTPLGRFVGDWSLDLEDALSKASKPITWASRKDSPYYQKEDGSFEQSKMLAQEENDLRNTGAPVDLKLTDVIEKDDIGATLSKMYQFFELEDPWVRLHIQRPGQMFNLHIDKLQDRCPEDPTRVVRIMVHLTDWEPGQFYNYGTQNITHWAAGDVHTFDWANVPHATANASRSLRPSMIMTGVATDKTKQIIESASKEKRYPI